MIDVLKTYARISMIQQIIEEYDNGNHPDNNGAFIPNIEI